MKTKQLIHQQQHSVQTGRAFEIVAMTMRDLKLIQTIHTYAYCINHAQHVQIVYIHTKSIPQAIILAQYRTALESFPTTMASIVILDFIFFVSLFYLVSFLNSIYFLFFHVML